MKVSNINKCANSHYFVEEVCPFCGANATEKLEAREGDCVKCGQLCPDGAYGCNEPEPMNIVEVWQGCRIN